MKDGLAKDFGPLRAFFVEVLARAESWDHMPEMGRRVIRLIPQLSAYTAVSAIALAADFASYLMLTDLGYLPLHAGVAGYLFGMLLHYILSSRFVFDRTASAKSEARLLSEFALSGVAGLAVTAGVISVATSVFGTGAIAAKLAAVFLSFIVVYVLRRTVVFTVRDA